MYKWDFQCNEKADFRWEGKGRYHHHSPPNSSKKKDINTHILYLFPSFSHLYPSSFLISKQHKKRKKKRDPKQLKK